jgi:Ca-activated chloride channel family protein
VLCFISGDSCYLPDCQSRQAGSWFQKKLINHESARIYTKERRVNFLAPVGFYFLLLIPVVIVMHLLKLRRQKRMVSSTMLWRRAVDDLRANTPFQRLRRSLLLLLQIVLVLLLVVVLARPYLFLRAHRGRSLIVLVDTSGSMKARANGTSRIAAARAEAGKIVDSMLSGDEMMLISFADKATVLTPFSGEKQKLRRIISGIEAEDVKTEIRDALVLAQSLVRGRKNAEVIVVSDGGFGTPDIPGTMSAELRFVNVGRAANNVAITAVDIRPYRESRRDYEVFAALKNNGSERVTAQLELLNNDKTVDVREVSMEPGAERREIFTNFRIEPGTLLVRLDARDALESDNAAYGVLGAPRKTEVTLVSRGNYFLEKALRAHADVNVTKVKPEDFASKKEADLVIFDNASAGRLAPGNYIFINAFPPVGGFAELGAEQTPVIFDWNEEHPVLRFVELRDVTIQRAKKLKLPEASLVLAESRETPLLVYYSGEGVNALIFTFDLYDSTLPLRAAFPILISNCIEFLERERRGEAGSFLRAGTIVKISAPKDVETVSVIDPAGRGWSVRRNQRGELLFDKARRVGFYRVEAQGKPSEILGVSLLDGRESSLAPAQAVSLYGKSVAATTSVGRTNREVWRWFALAALAIIVLEWLVYHRRILV